MCFSAPVSFTAAGFLALAAIYSIRQASQARSKAFLPIAMIPLFFAIQQFTEGWIWVLLNSNQTGLLTTVLTYFYVFIAYSFWPFYAPFSLAFFDRERRILFQCLAIVGFLFAIGSFTYLIIKPDLIEARIVSNSICYLGSCTMRAEVHLTTCIYLILTVGSLMLSSFLELKLMGVALLLFAALSFTLYQLTFASTWCFFSALISLYIAVAAHKYRFLR